MAKQNVLRQSQLITTFGPGAMVDLPTRSVVIGGLERWDVSKAYREIDEPALSRILERGLQKQERLAEGKTLRLLAPPVTDRDDYRDIAGVHAPIFPTWFLCERVDEPTINGEKRRGRRMVVWNELSAQGGRKAFEHDDGKKDDVTPLRFVGACEKGHLQDIDWRTLVHSGTRCREPMYLAEDGTSANIADLEIICGCGANLHMREAFMPNRLGFCEGRMPWIAADAQEPCVDESGKQTKLRLLTRSATNAYFPQSLSVISLPISEDRLTALVKEHWSTLSEVEALAEIATVRRFNPQVREALKDYSDEEVFDRVNQIRTQDDEVAAVNPRLAEFDILASGRTHIGSNDSEARLYAETLEKDEWVRTGLSHDLSALSEVVAVHRLREVMALYGFTRFEPAPSAVDDEIEDVQLAVRGARISEDADWVPAVEQFGEGIFIKFDAAKIDEWERSPAVRNRWERLFKGYEQHRTKHPNSAERNFPGLGYIVLHGLSHALISEICLDCGYPASSLKERIYAFPARAGEPGRYGILIYTATTGAQGTLGGLVGNASRVAEIINAALNRQGLCSNDPVCADHDPSQSTDELSLLGAACHGCLLIAETSCERRNQFLDRALLIETLSPEGASLFSS